MLESQTVVRWSPRAIGFTFRASARLYRPRDQRRPQAQRAPRAASSDEEGIIVRPPNVTRARRCDQLT